MNEMQKLVCEKRDVKNPDKEAAGGEQIGPGLDDESFEEGRIEQLEEGTRNWSNREIPPVSSKDFSSDKEDPARKIHFLKEKVEQMEKTIEELNKKEHANSRKVEEVKEYFEDLKKAHITSVEELKKQHVTSRTFEEFKKETEDTAQELKGLVPSSSASANNTLQRAGTRGQIVSRDIIGSRSMSALSASSFEKLTLDDDAYSLMIVSKSLSLPWILGFVSFCCQMILGVMIIYEQFSKSADSSIFGVPFKADNTSVHVAQFLAIILCLSTQSDILNSIRSFFLLGFSTDWDQVIDTHEKSRCTWFVRVGLPNTFKLCQGLVVMFASFVIIVQSKGTIDLLKDFTSLMVISGFDNIIFYFALNRYLGDKLCKQARKIAGGEYTISNGDSTNGINVVRFTFVVILLAMFTGWGTLLRMQRNGDIFDSEFPDCGKDNYALAFKEFYDKKCYGGPLNTIECKYEGGDCATFNTAYPSCNGEDLAYLNNVEEELGDGICNMQFAIEQCDYDGGDCCNYDIRQSVLFGDGKCDGGLFNTEGCLYDFGDCDSFHRDFPDCALNDESLISQSYAGIILGDGICDGGSYNVDECGFEYNDCSKGQIGGDIFINGVISRFENAIDFKIWMNAKTTKLLVEMPYTDEFGNYDALGTNGTIAGYSFNSSTLTWIYDEKMDKERVQHKFGQYYAAISERMAVSGDGSTVAVGSPFYYEDNEIGRVAIFDFWGEIRHDHYVLNGKEDNARFGYHIDLTGDGTHIAISSPRSDSYSGKIQVFEKNEESSSEKLWTQLGTDIIGDESSDIGYYYVGLNSSDGSRVYFSGSSTQLLIYEFDSQSQEWIQQAIDDLVTLPFSVQQPDVDSKDLITISADGNRFAVSTYKPKNAYNLETEGTVTIYDYSPGESSWNRFGPTISSDENGFGRSISMNDDGALLAISAVDPNCDGKNRYEKNQYGGTLQDGASDDLCGTGSVQLYRYRPTNPPWRPFTRLPQIRDINSQRIMETEHQVMENMILGLQVYLSGDGSVLTVSGYDIDRDFGFVKTFDVKELYYIDCIIDSPERIGNDEQCWSPIEPEYTEQCGYKGGDCPLPPLIEGLNDCKVYDSGKIGDGVCLDRLPYNSKECNYDGGDCLDPSKVDEYVDEYPDCLVLYPGLIRDGKCNDWLPYNSYECGFDGDNCRPAEFNPTFSPLNSI